MKKFDEFLAELQAEFDISGYDFVAIKAWNAALDNAAQSCEIIVSKCDDHDSGFGSNAASDCVDVVRAHMVSDGYTNSDEAKESI